MENMSQRLQYLSPEKRKLFELYHQNKKTGNTRGFSDIKPVEGREYYPLSPAQKRMYMVNQIEGSSISYNIPGAVTIEGSLDKAKLGKTFKELIKRHEAFQTSFEMVDGEPIQKIHSEVHFEIMHMEADEEQAEEIMAAFIKPFDLSRAPLLRVGLVKLTDKRHILMYDMHHIISDGTSSAILRKEFVELYSGNKLPDLRIQYKDYSEWQNSLLKSEKMKKHEEYWLDRFKGEIPELDMPTDYPRPSYQSFEGNRIYFEADNELMQTIGRLTEDTGTTLYMVLLSVYSILLSKYTGQEDIIVGSPIAGRPHTDLENIIGMFVNTLAMRNHPVGEKTFREFLLEVKENNLKAHENQDYQFEELVERLKLKRDISRNPLFDTMFVLQNTGNMDVPLDGLKFISRKIESKTAKFDLTLNAVEQRGKIAFGIEYCTRLFKKNTIKRLAEHFMNILRDIAANPDIRLSDINMLLEEEKEKLIYRFNRTKADYPKDKTIYELFEEQVEKTPDNTAVVFGENQLTYRELNEKANSLARVLREKGVKPDSIVGIAMERSSELIISVLGVLKAGGAYLPIEVDYPQDRIMYMLEDSKANILLTDRLHCGKIDFMGEAIVVEELFNNESDGANLKQINQPVDLAYVIYTSGSTGNPKGVMIHHKGLTNYIVWASKVYKKEDKLDFPLYSSISFDLTVTSIFTPLISGGKIVIYRGDKHEPLIYKVFEENIVSIVKLTPAHLQLISDLDNSNSSIKTLIVGGEELKTEITRKVYKSFGGKVEIFNEYGPTETVVGCMIYKFSDSVDKGLSVPIGIPADNVQIYLLDRYLKPVPEGIAGEIYISGDGVARGYLNRTELTDERFIPNPFISGERMYKTGDVAKFLPDGNIEYLGRIDHQVKIRGFRIELGEVEGRMLKHGQIKEAVVMAKEDSQGGKYLCAYYVSDSELSLAELRGYLSKELPDYMIPSFFIYLDSMPLTTNGKVDRKALPEPEGSINTGVEYVPPANEVEERLAMVWQEVLGLDRVGINDNFFELGGDSIKAIQVSSRLNKHGMKIEIKDLMKKPNIRELSGLVKTTMDTLVEQGAVEGEVRLTPVQKWFFEKNFTGMHHWNQAVMLHGKNGFDEDILRRVFSRIVEHHDALRMVYRTQGGKVVQYNRGLGDGELFTLETIDLTEDSGYETRIEEESTRIQSAMELGTGSLVRLGLFKTAEGGHLLIAIHHLVVDGVSWRVIFEDLAAGYEQADGNKEITLQDKTSSFKDWALKIEEYAGSRELLKQREYWKGVVSKINRHIPVDTAAGVGSIKDCRTAGIALTKEDTDRLVRQSNRAYNTEINDILLTALGLAIKEWSGLEQVAINLEGHGREDIADNTDISRTVGWFTSSYPVALEMQGIGGMAYAIKSVKESLRRIPNKGIGYGVLKYISLPEHRQGIDFSVEPEISFNYLGSFGHNIDTGVFGISRLSTGQTVHSDSQPGFKIDINGIIAGDSLVVNFRYNTCEYRDETIARLADMYRQKLLEIVEHCAAREKAELTPSDYGDTGLGINELENICGIYGENIQWIYPLTPMQQGMLFHALDDRSSHAYFEQISFDIKGYVDAGLVQKSVDMLLERYDILRTGIIHKGLERPRQVVLKKRNASIHSEDISAMTEDTKQQYIEALGLGDRQAGFDLTHDSLLRVSLLKTGMSEYRFIWSFHHIIMDGWCLPIVFGELFEAYAALSNGNIIDWKETTPYRNYIYWLQKQDREAAMKYWSDYLAGYEGKAIIPKSAVKPPKGEYRHDTLEFLMDEEVTAGLSCLAKAHKVTLNTVFQAIWGLMLHRYNNTTDVVFGTVVSGRPAEVAGIEKMVGLFINTIPVRIESGEDMTFEALIEKVHENGIMSEKYSFCPLAEVQALSSLRNELIDHLIVFENYPIGQLQKENAGQAAMEIVHDSVKVFEQTNYDFDVTIVPGSQLMLRFAYNFQAYDKKSIHAIGLHLETLAKNIIDDPGIRLSKLNMLTEEEKEELLYRFNNTKVDYPKGKTIYELFEEQVERTPDNIAEVFEGKQLTYRELNDKSNSLARVLREKGVKPDDIVGIMSERSLEMIIGIMGILKAGGAYLPIDPNYPVDRISYILEDSGTNILLAQSKFISMVEFRGELIDLDNQLVCSMGAANPGKPNKSDNLAYVIYTSGSTGNPKGAMIEHYSLVNRLNWMQKKYPIGEEDVILQKTPYTFDVSVWEILWWSAYGAKVCLLTPGGEKDPETIIEAIEKNKVTTMHFVPSMLNVFLEYIEDNKNTDRVKSLRQVICSGEALTVQQVKKFNRTLNKRNGTKLHNLYGPTEATIDVSYFDCPAGENFEYIPIGKPIDNISLYIVDKNNNIQPVGAAGELCIGGDGLARGYLNRPELTNEKFVPNPFETGKRMYRTGDLGRWLPDGNIEYLGRIDHQVKIRGFRIELGEIESRLLEHEAVKEAVIIARENKDGDKYLCSYIVTAKELNIMDLKDHLSKALPDYMIPPYFVQLEKLPLSTNGKINRKALPEPEGMGTGMEYEAPRNETEQKLVEIWQELLNINKVGINDSFFNLGGDSIKSITLINRINKATGASIQIKDIYENQSIKKIAEAMNKNTGYETKESLQDGLKIIDELKNVILSDEKQMSKLPEDYEEFYPLSRIQQGMVFYSRLRPEEPIYHDQFVYQVKFKEFNKDVYQKTINLMIEKHPVLRTVFNIEQFNEFIQIVHKKLEPEAFIEDISNLTANEQEACIIDYMKEDLRKKFKFNNDLLWRMKVYSIGNENYCIVLSTHHAIMDGWSIASFITEITEIYNQLIREGTYRVKKLENSYKDYVAINISRKASNMTNEFWKEIFDGYTRNKLPFNISGKKINSIGGSRIYTGKIGRNLFARLEAQAKEYGCTLKDICLSAHIYLLGITTSERDVVSGVVTHDRPAIEDSEKILGCFLNTVPIRIKLSEKVSKSGLIEKVKEYIMNVKAHELFLSDIAAIIGETGNTGNPIFDTLFNFIDFHVMKGIETSGRIENVDNYLQIEKNEMTNTLLDLEVVRLSDDLIIQIKYSPDFFIDSDIEAAINMYVRILGKFADSKGEYLSSMDLITEGEKQRILYDFNSTESEYPKNKTIHKLFEEQVERTPDNIAVVFGDKKLTYRELNEKANRLANYLVTEKNIRPDSLVGIVMERSENILVGIMGVLKSGGAYVPIDPEYPAGRIKSIINDSGINVIVSTQKQIKTLSGLQLECEKLDTFICIDGMDVMDKYDASPVCSASKADNLAYVIYTSGSTGKPKGVMIEHRAVNNFIRGMSDKISFEPDKKILAITTICFDIFMLETLLPLSMGMSIVMASEEEQIDPAKLRNVIIQNNIEMLQLTPSRLKLILDSNVDPSFLADRTEILIGGEALPENVAGKLKRISKLTRIYNVYGPTETTIWSTVKELTEAEAITIGKPIANTQVYILDKKLEPQLIGVAGELYISGDGVARGYINNTELTSEKFVQNPFTGKGRMYNTGDLARWLPDGEIEHIGRVDHQVKIRGFRIELGEIEGCLMKMEHIREAVVIATEDKDGNKSLCAYIVTEKELIAEELGEQLSRELPGYMIPSYFIQLEKMPLTPNGKIDRKALPEPDESMNSGMEYEAPSNETELKLVEIWREVLGVERVGVTDNFFSLGGHSLKATALISKIHKQFNVEVPLKEVFVNPTIRVLARHIEQANESIYATITHVEEKEYYPVSPAQRRMYMLNLIEGSSTSYNMPGAVILEGSLVKARLEETFRELVIRHGSFRTSFEMIGGEPVQRIHRDVEFEVMYVEIEEEQAEGIMQGFIKPFDLSVAPLLRVGLVKLAGNKHILMYDMHHIISDGTSMAILVREFIELYNGKKLPELTIQYKDYSEWQNKLLKSDVMKKQEEYWLDVLKGEIPVLGIPVDYLRPPFQSFEGDVISFEVGNKLTQAINKLTADTGATMYMVLLSAYNILLSKYTGQEDIIVGSPIEGRSHADLENIIGMFVNTLAMRNYPEGEKTFAGFLQEVKGSSLKAYENQSYQFEELVERLDIKRDLSRNPVFDTMFILQNTDRGDIDTAGLVFKPFKYENKTSKFDLTLEAVEAGDKIIFSLEYCARLFKKETIQRLAGHFVNILHEVTQSPSVKLSEIQVLSEEERTQILVDFNRTEAEYHEDKTIHRLFEEQAERIPDDIAVIFGGNTLSYKQLNERSNRLANYLTTEKNIRPDSLVGIMMERSQNILVGIMGILKSGGAYVPIDPEYPAERIKAIINDSGINVIVSTQKQVQTLNKLQWECEKLDSYICIDGTGVLDKYDINPVYSASKADNLAYVIYTSGSTGKPKGVMIEHRAVNNFIKGMSDRISFEPGKKILAVTTICFDIFMLETLLPLSKGMSIVMANEEEQINPTKLRNVIVKNNIEMLQLTPSRLKLILDSDVDPSFLADRTEILIGGEALPENVVGKLKRITKSTRIYNVYGPTETTIWSTVKELTEEESITIGRPIANTRVYILDKNLEPQPVGVAGELYISGDGVARGYINNIGLTSGKFIQDPFTGEGRMYNTGDMARWLPDGEIEHLGRVDYQVKIRGFRIELGEIEGCLMKMESVREAVVIAREDKAGNKNLCAYITTEKEITIEELRKNLSMELPDYMIPSYFVKLEKLPLTPNGKIDRKELPGPDGSMNTGREYEAPANETEAKLVEIWQEVLGIERVGVNDNFFDLGGNSLKAVQMITLLRKNNIELNEVFRHPTISELSKHVRFISDTSEPLDEKLQSIPTVSGEIDRRLIIKPSHKPWRNCYEDAVVSVLSWLGRGHELIYLGSWRFGFMLNTEEPISIGKRLNYSFVNEKTLSLLKRFYGVKLEYHFQKSIDETFAVINRELKLKKPIIIGIDSYWVPWDSIFQITHSHHSVLVVGIDESKQQVYCTDPIYSIEHCILSYECIQNGIQNYITFEIDDEYDMDFDWRENLKNTVLENQNSVDGENMFKAIRDFADAIEHSLDVAKEIEGYMDIGLIPLNECLRGVAFGKYKFARFIEYLAKCYQISDLFTLSDNFKLIGAKWDEIRGLLFKVLASHTYIPVQTIAAKIREAAEYEESTALQLLELCMQPKIKTGGSMKEQILAPGPGVKDVVFIDLQKYFNNNIFLCTDVENYPKHLPNGVYFKWDEKPTGDVWQFGEMKFIPPVPESNRNDSLVCTGQTIQLPCGNYSSIMFLGNGEWGSFSGEMTLNYAGGKTEKSIIGFDDWNVDPVGGEVVAWKGKAVGKTENGIQPHNLTPRIFAKKYRLQNGSTLESLQLPINPCIHIYAISLGKSG